MVDEKIIYLMSTTFSKKIDNNFSDKHQSIYYFINLDTCLNNIHQGNEKII